MNLDHLLCDRRRMKALVAVRIPEGGRRIVVADGPEGEVWVDLDPIRYGDGEWFRGRANVLLNTDMTARNGVSVQQPAYCFQAVAYCTFWRRMRPLSKDRAGTVNGNLNRSKPN
jgi:hypothetical protein